MLRGALIFRGTPTFGTAPDSQRDPDTLRGTLIIRGTLAVGGPLTLRGTLTVGRVPDSHRGPVFLVGPDGELRGAPTTLTCFFVGFCTVFVTSLRVSVTFGGVLTLAGFPGVRKSIGGTLSAPSWLRPCLCQAFSSSLNRWRCWQPSRQQGGDGSCTVALSLEVALLFLIGSAVALVLPIKLISSKQYLSQANTGWPIKKRAEFRRLPFS